jgi:hypothetical protein
MAINAIPVTAPNWPNTNVMNIALNNYSMFMANVNSLAGTASPNSDFTVVEFKLSLKVGQYYHQGELTVQKIVELDSFPTMLEAFRTNNVEETAAAYFNTGLTENHKAFSNIHRNSHPDWVHEFTVLYIMNKDSTPAGWYYYRYSQQDFSELRTAEGFNKRIIKTAPFRLSNFGSPSDSRKLTSNDQKLTMTFLNKIQDALGMVYESKELDIKGKACLLSVKINYNVDATTEDELDINIDVNNVQGLKVTSRDYFADKYYNAGIFIPKILKAKGMLTELKVVVFQIKYKTIFYPIDVKCL